MSITLLKAPAFSQPMNAPHGLYMQILSRDGWLKPGEIYDFCAPLARQHGFDPDGRGLVGGATGHGIKSLTYAVWFYDKLKEI